MNQSNLAETSSPSTPMTITRAEAEAKIETFHGKLEPVDGQPTQFCVSRAAAPSIIERRQLSAVASRLERDVAPFEDPIRVEAAIALMIIGFDKGKGMSALNTKMLNQQFVRAVRRKPYTDPPTFLPIKAIEAAIDRYGCGETLLPWDPEFRPNPGQFALEVKEGMVETNAKLVRVRRVLNAIVYDPTPAELRGPDCEDQRAAIVKDALSRAKLDAGVHPGIQERAEFENEEAGRILRDLDATTAAWRADSAPPGNTDQRGAAA